MSSCTFTIYTDGDLTGGDPVGVYHFHCELPDTITYSDGRILTRLNLWNNTYVGDSGKSTENITMQGFTVDKATCIDYFDYAVDQGWELTITNFNNTDIDGVWLMESFSYTRDVPGGYSYSLQLERVR